jgi:hypothetical protein
MSQYPTTLAFVLGNDDEDSPEDSPEDWDGGVCGVPWAA